MPSFATVVVGVDGSPGSDAALAWAVDHLQPGGRLHLVHGFSRTGKLAQRNGSTHAEAADSWSEPARALGVEPAITFVDEDPADALVSACIDLGAEVVVVGTHGAGDSSHLLGSVTRKLVRTCPAPVVVVPGTPRPEPEEPVVLACVGPGESSERAAFWAADQASTAGRPLVLLHVVRFRPFFPRDSLTEMLGSYLGRETGMEWAKADLDDLGGRIAQVHADVEIRTVVAGGRVPASIDEHDDQAELVVIGRGRTGRFTHDLVGSLTRQIVTRTVAPIAVVPPDAPVHRTRP